ncbi:hypothetical protein CXB51_024228 [Gossypium anomalum]|uniref:Uncharacterized protein n=1 Tax=Gossypium anomalum TaxID=47600 RepID=A0A8J5YFS6_9ROSI|nr:hypothetical protein CXB51_024228 [Gossypium anomalum]
MNQAIVNNNIRSNALSLHFRKELESLVQQPVFTETVNDSTICYNIWFETSFFHHP